jgi:gluconolactonase
MIVSSTVFRVLFAIFLFIILPCSGLKGFSSVSSNNDALMEGLKVEVYDSTALTLIDPNASFEILATGFMWCEGPLWIDDLQAVIFSDVPANKIFKWSENESLSIYLESAGHTGTEYRNSDKGSNGLMLDLQNRLVICQHGDRRIVRMDADVRNPQQRFVTIADRYEGKQFNSPNDLAMDRTGNIYFTDPPYGQPGNRTAEIGMNGVFKVTPDNLVTLLIDSLTFPNGIALSLDEKTLYVNQSDQRNPVLYSYNITEDGSLEGGKVLFNFSILAKHSRGMPDGLKIHKSGNIFATGPGGVHIISPEGIHLAAIKTGKSTANCAFDSDHKFLYMTTTDLLIRIKL